MAYFLKKTKNKKGLYLQIYESHYDPFRKQTVHSSVRPLGYEHELKQQGIDDPITHFKEEIARLNAERKSEKAREKVRRIGEVSPEKHVGHFALSGIQNILRIERDFSYLALASGFKFDLYQCMCDLIYARAVVPASKLRTFEEVIPSLFGSKRNYSLDQLYDGFAYLGREYRKVIEIYNTHIDSVFERDTQTTYFDCTNFYFEIDRQDDLRKKGPSKEHRCDPIVGMGLLLDGECIPLSMQIYPGNESEKPVIRDIIASMKGKNHITGKTVRVADKGLNCAANIYNAILSKDGYIFSKSVKTLPELELFWALSEKGWREVSDSKANILHRMKSTVDVFDYTLPDKTKFSLTEKRIVTFNPSLAKKQIREINRQVERARSLRLSGAKKSEYGDSAKFVTFTPVDENGEIPENTQVIATLNHAAIKRARALAGYNMIVTSEIDIQDKDVCEIYHELWHIEESFLAMKSLLDVRPVYARTEESIYGHFLICYLSLLLERLLQIKVLDGQFGTEEIIRMIRDFRVVETSPSKYINISKSSPLIDKLEALTSLPLSNYYLTKGQVSSIMKWKATTLCS